MGSHDGSSNTIVLSGHAFRVVWCLVSLFHVFNAVFTFIVGGAHLLLAIPTVYENMFLIRIPRNILVLTGWSYMAVGILHLGAASVDLARSVRSCKLTFGHDGGNNSSGTQRRPLQIDKVSSIQSESARTRSMDVITAPVRVWRRNWGLHGRFGVFGPRFEAGFHSRQLIEIALQTYQAYQLSHAVPRLWINQFVVTMIAVNCFSTPLHVVSSKKMFRMVTSRTVTIILDLIIDFAINVVVPICVLVPRILAFDWTIGAIPPELVYDDVWLTTAVSEARQVLVTSLIDYASSLLPPVMWLFALDSLKNVFRRRRDTRIGPSEHLPGSRNLISVQPTVPRSATSTATIATASSTVCTPKPSWLLRHFNAMISFTSIVWGFVVIALHVLAVNRQIPSSLLPLCALRVSAWESVAFSCAVVKFDCHRLRQTGDAMSISSILSQFDSDALTRIIFTHCTHLEVPPIIATLSQLRAFVTFNCTITSWPTSAALTNTHTPLVVSIDMVDTNFTISTLPPGILHSNLPVGVNLLLYRSNLTELPADIGTVWGGHKWISMWIEDSQLTALPESFGDLHIQKLALMSNHRLVKLHHDIFATQAFAWLRLSRNNLLTTLPELGDTTALTHLIVEDTNVSTLPTSITQWLDNSRTQVGVLKPTLVVTFVGSPVCPEASSAGVCTPVSALRKDEFRYDLVVAQRPIVD